MKSKRHTWFRWFYKGIYSLLCAVLFVLILVPPGDTIKQALRNRQLYNVFVIAGCYVLTLLVAAVLYFTRLYTNNSILKAIPKTWIPVEKDDVSKKVRKMIVASLNRSAAITWDSRPRVPDHPATIVSEPDRGDPTTKPAGTQKDNKEVDGLLENDRGDTLVTIPPPRPVWGDIAHNGWSSPTSPDLANLQYTTVILELPHLIEAKAVSLAPLDQTIASQPPLADARAVELLQRPAAMGLRDYIGHLISTGIIIYPEVATGFLAAYEHARFSGRPISEPGFRELMKQFAELLRSIKCLSPAILASLGIDPPESDIDNDGTSTSTPKTERSRSLTSSLAPSSRSNSQGTVRTVPSRRTGTNGSPSKIRDGFMTAPATPRSKKRMVSRTPSADSFAQSRRIYNENGSSSESLRSVSQTSVIRLSRTNEEGELPYTLNIPRSR